MPQDRFRRAIQAQRKAGEPFSESIPGQLGIPFGGVLTVDVPNRNGYVFVQLRNSSTEVIQAFNDQVAPSYGLPVYVKWQGNRYIVMGRDTLRYNDWMSQSSYLPRHGPTHEFDIDGGGGGDVVFTYQRQIRSFMPTPSGTSSAKGIVIGDYLLANASGTFYYYPQQTTSDLTVWKPTTSGAVMVLISEDTTNHALRYDVNSGSFMSTTYTGTSQIYPYIPTIPSQPRYLPIAAVRLVSGTDVIGWGNIYDVRQMFTQGFGGSSSSQVQDEGIIQGNATVFNFVGAGVTATISGSVANINVPGGGGGGGIGGILAEDEGILLGTGTIFNFRGTPITATISGSTIDIFITGTPGAAGPTGPAGAFGVFAQDEGVPLGTGTVLNFVGAGVTATISGTVVNVNVPNAGGGGGGTPIYPRQATIWPPAFMLVSGCGGTIDLLVDGAQLFNAYGEQHTAADGDIFQSTAYLRSGTYTMRTWGYVGTNRGKLDYQIDGVTVVSGQDWYSASNTRNVVKTGSVSIPIPTSGEHVLRVVVNGKNGSSSGYFFVITFIELDGNIIATEAT